jgi:hypothetical protein
MQAAGMVCTMLFCVILGAGCMQIPGIHMISDTPDPIIGQWIGGEPPESDMHVVFYENQTFLSLSFFISTGVASDTGTWTKIGSGHYSTQSVSGGITNWSYDSFMDLVYRTDIPQRKYYRYKG